MPLLEQTLSILNFSKYLIVFVLCIVEGPIVMLTSGFLYRLGEFSLFPLYLSLMSGDFVADLGWYAVGRFAAGPIINKFGRFLNLTPEIINKIEQRFKTYQNKILFISKITMGFGFALATLIVAGMLKVNFKKYAVLNFFGGFIWTAFLVTIGYFFGNIYALISTPFKIIFVIIGLPTIVFALWALNRRLTKAEI